MQLPFHDTQYLGLGIMLTGSKCPLYSRLLVCWAALVPEACCLNFMLQFDVDCTCHIFAREIRICHSSASSRLHVPVRNAAHIWRLALLLLKSLLQCLMLCRVQSLLDIHLCCCSTTDKNRPVYVLCQNGYCVWDSGQRVVPEILTRQYWNLLPSLPPLLFYTSVNVLSCLMLSVL